MRILFATLALLLPLSASADSFFGVGLSLYQEENKTYVEQILPGAPVERDGRIKAEDEIIAVQNNSAWIPVANLPIAEVISMIRGAEGARVGLHLMNKTGQFEVFLDREKIAFSVLE